MNQSPPDPPERSDQSGDEEERFDSSPPGVTDPRRAERTDGRAEPFDEEPQTPEDQSS